MKSALRKTKVQLVGELAGLRKRTAELEAALADKTRELELASVMLDSIPMRISYVDSEERYLFYNKIFERRYGYIALGSQAKREFEAHGRYDYALWKEHFETVLAGQQVTSTYRDDGGYWETTYLPDFGPDGGGQGSHRLCFGYHRAHGDGKAATAI